MSGRFTGEELLINTLVLPSVVFCPVLFCCVFLVGEIHRVVEEIILSFSPLLFFSNRFVFALYCFVSDVGEIL